MLVFMLGYSKKMNFVMVYICQNKRQIMGMGGGDRATDIYKNATVKVKKLKLKFILTRHHSMLTIFLANHVANARF